MDFLKKKHRHKTNIKNIIRYISVSFISAFFNVVYTIVFTMLMYYFFDKLIAFFNIIFLVFSVEFLVFSWVAGGSQSGGREGR